MQTFMPHIGIAQSLMALDRARLGKQRVEARQLIRAIQGNGYWGNHPAAQMWRYSLDALKYYYNTSLRVWAGRGYVNNMEIEVIDDFNFKFPWWIGHKAFHLSHRSNLLRKMPEFYEEYNWQVRRNLEYLWPHPSRPEFTVGTTKKIISADEALNLPGIKGVHFP